MIKDAFYRELDDNEIILANMGKFNFDHPDAFDTELMESVLQVNISFSVLKCYTIMGPL